MGNEIVLNSRSALLDYKTTQNQTKTLGVGVKLLIAAYLISLSVSSTYFNALGFETPIGSFNIVRAIQVLLTLVLAYRPRLRDNSKFEIGFVVFYLIYSLTPIVKEYWFGMRGFDSALSSSLNRYFLFTPLYLILSRCRIKEISKLLVFCLFVTSCIQLLLMLTIKRWEAVLNLQYATLYSDGIERYGSIFAFGDSNSLAAFQVLIMALFIHMSLIGKLPKFYLPVVMVIGFVTVSYTASRGGMISLILVLFLTVFRLFKLNRISKSSLATGVIIAFSLLGILIASPGLLDNAIQRSTGARMETDFDLENEAGRFGRAVIYLEFIVNKPSVLALGDYNDYLWHNWYGTQAVHIAFLYAIQVGGIIYGAFVLSFLVRFVLWSRRCKAMYLSVPVVASALTLPVFGIYIYLPLIMSLIEDR